MKIPKIIKLNSGNYRIQLRLNGKSYSITAGSEKECIKQAELLKAKYGIGETVPQSQSKTVGQAVDEYIEARDGILSPSTIRTYKSARATAMQDIMNIRIDKLTLNRVQQSINQMKKDGCGAKHIKNVWALVNSSIKAVDDSKTFKVILPQREKPAIAIPDIDEMRAIMNAFEDDPEMKAIIYLAIGCGLRQSEIRGLRWTDIQNGIIHIHSAIVQGEKNVPYEKLTKTSAGDRYIPLPDYIASVLDQLPHNDEHITLLSGKQIYDRYKAHCVGLPLKQEYRFHDLRHCQASIGLALGVPNRYMQQRMGHSTDNMLKTVYQHTIQSVTDSYNAQIDNFMSNLLTDCSRNS